MSTSPRKLGRLTGVVLVFVGAAGVVGRGTVANEGPWRNGDALPAVAAGAQKHLDVRFETVDQKTERSESDKVTPMRNRPCGGAVGSRPRAGPRACRARPTASGGPATASAGSFRPAPSALV